MVTGPLAEFQHTLATKDDTYRLVQTINAAIADGRGRLTDTHLKRAFERCWPELEQCLEALPEPQEPIPPPRKPEDMVQELLETVRGLVNPRQLSANQQVLGRLARMIARFRSLKDLSAPTAKEDLLDLLQESQHLRADVEYYDQQRTREREEFSGLVDQFEEEITRLASLVNFPANDLSDIREAIQRVKGELRTPARGSEVLMSSGSPTAQRKNRPAAKVRQGRQRRRPS